VDELALRYENLVAAWSRSRGVDARLQVVAREARALAADAEPTWYRVQATALAAAADALVGRSPDLVSVVDATGPSIDEAAPERLGDLAAGSGSLADGLSAHRAATTVDRAILPRVMAPVMTLLWQRARDDLELSREMRPLEIGTAHEGSRSAQFRIDRLDGTGRLVLNVDRRWTAGRVVRVAAAASMQQLAGMLRPPRAEWQPSPQGTVDHGLQAVGREVLMGDHELAYELGRIGRSNGLQWSGERIVAVERAIDELAPALAAMAIADDRDAPGLGRLGVGLERVHELSARWRDPLARADCVASAAGPTLVRAWLVRTGQTNGLGRLLREWLVPTELRGHD